MSLLKTLKKKSFFLEMHPVVIEHSDRQAFAISPQSVISSDRADPALFHVS